MISTSNLQRITFFIITVDALVLPYFPFFAINSLFFLVFVSFAIKSPSIPKKYFNLVISFVILACLSTFISNLVNPEFLSENLKRLIQFLIFFISYFYYYDYFKNTNAYRSMIVLHDIFYFSVFSWVVLYIYNLEYFLQYKLLFNKNDGFIDFLEDGTTSVYRFSYIWTDPNNIAYAILGMFIFSLINLKVSGIRKFTYLFITLLVLLGSMSTAGWLIFAFVVSPIFIFNSSFLKLRTSRFSLIAIPLISLLAFVYFPKIYSYIIDSNIVNMAIDRYESNNIKTESGTSRLEIWSNVISMHTDNIYKYFFIGDGYQLNFHGQPIKPHNGILLILFAYGLPALLIFLYLFFHFKLNKNYLFMIPFFICFLINIMIGETKLMLLYIYLLTYVRAVSKIGNNL